MITKMIYSQTDAMNKLGLNAKEFLALISDAPVMLYKRYGTEGGGYWVSDEVIEVLKQLLTIKNKQNEHRTE